MMPISVLSVLICAGAVWGVVHQHNALAALRQEQETRLIQISKTPTTATAAVASAPNAQSLNPPSDLIQLRAEFARLTQRRRELEPVRAENESLKAKLSTAASTAAGAAANDAGYIRKSQARMAGYNTPEDTVQTMLWAINNRDTNALLEAFDPQMAMQVAKDIQREGFDGAEALVRLKILERQTLPDGRIVLNVLSDANPNPEPITFSLIGGKWRVQDKH
jgi:hypothetical protein